MADLSHMASTPGLSPRATQRGHGRKLRARTGGLLLLSGGVLSPLVALGRYDSQAGLAPTLALGAASAFIGLLLLAFPTRAPRFALGLLVPFGTLLITAAIKLNGLDGVTADTPIFYVLVVLYAFYFLSLRAALAQLALVAAAYGWLLLSEVPADIALARWLTTVSVMLAAGLLVQRMNQRMDGLIEALSVTARQDALTGLLNRRGFDERFGLELARSRRTREPISLLMVDLDHFKRLNDSRGHAAGDEALRRVAGMLEMSARDVDAVARIGGEEFAVLVPGSGGPLAWRIAERLREQLARESEDWSTPLTTSIGVASAPPLEPEREALMEAADAALYRAKDLGRDRTIEAGGPEMTSALAAV